MIVLGDFNCNTASENPDKNTVKLIETFDQFNMKQIITKPTRINATTKKTTTIDHIWADPNLNIIKESGTVEGISDHAGIYATINVTKPKTGNEKIRYRCYRNYSPEHFNKELETALKDEALNELIENVDEATERWVKIFTNTAENHAPMKERNIKAKNNFIPWFTSELKELIEEKKRRLQLYWMDGFLTDLKIVKAL